MERYGESRIHRIVIALVSSSLLVTLPNFIWSSLGYLSLPAIILESAIVVFAFFLPIITFASQNFPGIAGLRRVLLFSILVTLFSFIYPPSHYFSTPLTYLLFLFFIVAISAAFPFRMFENRHIAIPISWKSYLLLGTALVLELIFFLLAYGFKTTDESIINYFSAHLVLSGLNPYFAPNLSRVFDSTSFPLNFTTPTLYGTYVTTLSYPALSFLVVVPAILLNVGANYAILPFYLLPPLILLYHYKTQHLPAMGVIVSLLICLNAEYFLLAGFADNDIVWVSLLMLGLMTIRSPTKTGVMVGLALSFKQFPLLIIPFWLFFIYREYGRKQSLLSVSWAAIAFLSVNSFFILSSPHEFFSSMLSSETTSLMGIGLGPSQLSFLNLVGASMHFFSFLMISLLLLEFLCYILFYDRLKGIFPILPMLPLLFNGRVLVQYLMYWPALALILVPYASKIASKSTSFERKVEPDSHRKRNYKVAKKLTIAVALVILIGAGISVHHSLEQKEVFKIKGATVKDVSGNNQITELSLNISYRGLAESSTPVYFRIVPQGYVGNVNGYLWNTTGGIMLHSSQYRSVAIYPRTVHDSLPQNNSYEIIAYYGGNIGSYYVTFNG